MLSEPMLVNTSLIPLPGKRYPPWPKGLGGYLFPGRGIKLVFTSIGPDNVIILVSLSNLALALK